MFSLMVISSQGSVITKSKTSITIGEGGKNTWDVSSPGGWDITKPEGDASKQRKRAPLSLPKPKYTGTVNVMTKEDRSELK